MNSQQWWFILPAVPRKTFLKIEVFSLNLKLFFSLNWFGVYQIKKRGNEQVNVPLMRNSQNKGREKLTLTVGNWK